MKPYIIFGVFILALLLWSWYQWETGKEGALANQQLRSKITHLESDTARLHLNVKAIEADFRAYADTKQKELLESKKNVRVKLVYRDKLKDAAKEDIQNSEPIQALVATDDSLTIMYMNDLDKCYNAIDSIKLIGSHYKSAKDSLQKNCEQRNTLKDSIIDNLEKKDKKTFKKLVAVGVISAFLGWLAGN